MCMSQTYPDGSHVGGFEALMGISKDSICIKSSTNAMRYNTYLNNKLNVSACVNVVYIVNEKKNERESYLLSHQSHG